MKKFLAVGFIFCVVFLLSGCKENTLSEADIINVINENELNVLNEENCGYKGEETELEVESVTIEKSNVFKDDASCDAVVELSQENVRAKVFYRFDLVKAKDGWNLKTVKNYKRFTISPVKGIDDDEVLEDIRKMYPASCEFSVDSNVFDEEKNTCEIVVSFTRENEISVASGFMSCSYEFDEKTFNWIMSDFNEEVKSIDQWNPYGKWYFHDGKYYFCVQIDGVDESGETAEIKLVTSEHKSVVYTADFQQSFTALVTPDNNSLYFEPFEVKVGEEKINLMLCLREDALYFSTENTNEYKKVNLPRAGKY